ncbi:MAG: PHP domain-containing protein [Synergistaceae bacterium]
MLLVDMHVHSLHSDGTYSIEKIVKSAKKRHLNMISITDHDTTSGLNEFKEKCKIEKINGLTGIELSAEADFVLHILGYRIDANNKKLNERLKEVREKRNIRNEKMCEKLCENGIEINIEEVKEIAQGEVIARPHIATLLVKKGYVSTNGEAFAKYLGRNGKAYVPRERLTSKECIQLINEAGGVAVIAHPLQTYLEESKLEALIAKLKNEGLWGIETIYTGYRSEMIYNITKLANKYSLMCTAGSDFHGENKTRIEMGMQVPDTLLPWARLGINI